LVNNSRPLLAGRHLSWRPLLFWCKYGSLLLNRHSFGCSISRSRVAQVMLLSVPGTSQTPRFLDGLSCHVRSEGPLPPFLQSECVPYFFSGECFPDVLPKAAFHAVRVSTILLRLFPGSPRIAIGPEHLYMAASDQRQFPRSFSVSVHVSYSPSSVA